VSAKSTLDVDALTSLKLGATISGAQTHIDSQDLLVTSDGVAESFKVVAATGALTSSGTVTTSDTTDASGTTVGTLAASVHMHGGLGVAKDARIIGSTHAFGAVSAKSTLDVDALTSLKMGATISGAQTHIDSQDLVVTSDGATQTFKVTGATGHTDVAGNLTVGGDVGFAGHMVAQNTQNAVGNDLASLSAGLHVLGGLGVNLDARILGNMWVFGDVETASVTCTSDRRKKKDIADVPTDHTTIEQIRPVTFKWIDGSDTRTHAGVIAQELEQLLPAAVKTDAAGAKSVEYNYLWTLMLASHQALLKSHNQLQERVVGLENRLARAASLRPRAK
jgi:hypothetical protein